MRLQLLLAIALAMSMFVYTNTLYIFPNIPKEGATGTATFEITSVSSGMTHFGKRWLYKGTITAFSSDQADISVKNLPCTISLQQSDDITRPPANCAYRIDGRLKENSSHRYAFKVGKHTPWYPIQGSHSFAEARFIAKQWVSNYIKMKITEPRAATFLAGIATGDFDDPLMTFEFSRFGVQHIMAISGFHFSIIAGILSILLGIALPKRSAVTVLLILLTSYFLFLGFLPSVMRAWMVALIALGGFLCQKQGSGLNSLGVALMVLLVFEPLFVLNLGFQLSFLSTAAILIFYQPFDYLIQQLFEKRRLSQMVLMNNLNQHGYCILVFFRQAMALNCAVILLTLPVLLHLFHKFPLMSLFYNLFFPFLVSISMLLMIFGFLLSWVPLIGDTIHKMNDHYTQFVLNTTYNFPLQFDVIWRVSEFPFEYLIIYASIIGAFGLFIRSYLDQKRESLLELL